MCGLALAQYTLARPAVKAKKALEKRHGFIYIGWLMPNLFRPSHRRRRLLFLLLLGAALLVFHARTKKPGELNALDRIVLTVSAPVQRGATWAYRWAEAVWHDYLFLIDVQQRNERLEREVTALRQRLNELHEMELENRRLRKLLDFSEQHARPMYTARVVGYDPTSRYRTIRIDRGTHGGVFRGLPVVTARGVVGRVLRAWADYADVLLLTDPQSGVDALVQRTRARGTVEGVGEASLRLKYLLRLDEVRPGDLVVTSGFDNVFPPGLVIGTVSRLRRRSSGVFQEVQITPAVDMSRIEEVAILATLPAPRPSLETRCPPCNDPARNAQPATAPTPDPHLPPPAQEAPNPQGGNPP